MFLLGRVATNDGSPIPNDMRIERVCNLRVRQQVYASSRGDFSMQMGSKADSLVDASGGDVSDDYARGNQNYPDGMTTKASNGGISRFKLASCELRASAAGFHASVISLVDLDRFGSSIDVGTIVVQRAIKPEGTTLSAIPYKAPKDARKAYERGLEAERKGKLAEARKYFKQAAELYPKYAIAWFQLGSVLEKENENDAAQTAYLKATAIDAKFVPPFLSLASMAYRERNWREVLRFSGHILDLDPLSHSVVTGYIVDLDPVNYAEAYFYNAIANYKLNKVDAAEKSALKAEHVDLRTNFPQLHLLLAEIFAGKNDYASAIYEVQTYLELVPSSKDGGKLREQLAKWEKLNGSLPTAEKKDPN
jgi:tetratricopeptide (TPR) repeat protein